MGDNNRMTFRITGWECVDWIHMAYGRDQWRALLNTVMSLLDSIKSGGCLD
jgi:hypothetical protein